MLCCRWLAGIFLKDILDNVPIDKYFELFKPMAGGEGGFVRICLDYKPVPGTAQPALANGDAPSAAPPSMAGASQLNAGVHAVLRIWLGRTWSVPVSHETRLQHCAPTKTRCIRAGWLHFPCSKLFRAGTGHGQMWAVGK